MATSKKPSRTTSKTIRKPSRFDRFTSSHYFMAIVFVAAFALAGVATLAFSRADSNTGPIVSALASNKCLDNSAQKKTNGNKIQLYTCNHTNAQQWTVKSNGTIVNTNGYCLDVKGAGKTPMTLVQLYVCTSGDVAEQWQVNDTTKTIINPHSGLCLDDKYSALANGTQIQIYTCNGTNAQKWNVTKPATTPTPTPTPAPSPTPTPVSTSSSWWKPASSAPISWNWVIGNPPAAPYTKTAVYDVDGFDNSTATVTALHAQGSKAICYIDVGTYEPGRSDDSLIPSADMGKAVQGWPGEKWLNIADIKGLTPVVTSRMKMCASKGFDAVEPDNIDGYTNSTGFPLTAAQQITYNQFLATTAHGLGLSIGLKNDVDQTAQLQPSFDWALDEECNKYSECATLKPFTQANKAVFNAEYTSDGETTAKFCAADAAAHINGVLFDLNLDGKTFQPCTNTW